MSKESASHSQVNKDGDSDSDNDIFVMVPESTDVSGGSASANVSNASTNSSGAFDERPMTLNTLEAENDPLKREEAALSIPQQDIKDDKKMDEDINLTVTMEENAALKSLLEGAMATIDRLEASNDKLKAEKQAEIDGVLIENANLKSEKESLTAKLQSSQSFSASELVVAEKQRLEMQTQVGKTRLNLIEVKGQLYDANETLKVKSEELSALNQKYLDYVKRATAEREDMEVELSRLSQENEELKFYTKCQDEHIIDLGNQLNVLPVVRDDSENLAEMKTLKIQVQTLTEQLRILGNKLQEELKTPRETDLLDYLQRRLTDLEEELDQKKGQIQKLTTDYQAEKNRTTELEKKVAEAASDTPKLTDENLALQRKMHSLEQVNAGLRDQFEVQTKELIGMRVVESQKETAWLDALKSSERQLHKSRVQIQNFESKLTDRDNLINKLGREIQKIRSDYEKSVKDLKEQCASEIFLVDQLLTELKKLREELEAEKSRLENENSERKEELNRKEQIISQINLARSKLQEIIDKYKIKYGES